MVLPPASAPQVPSMQLTQFLQALGFQNLLQLPGQPHPLSCLPFPIFQNAVNEISYRLQAPYWLVVPTCLAAIAVSCQWQIKIRMPATIGGVKSPTLIVYVTALPGEGKSPTENLAFEAIKSFNKEQRKKFELCKKDWQVQHLLWKDDVEGLRGQKKTMMRNGIPTDDLDLELEALMQAEPVKPVRIKIVYEDATSAACFHSLSTGFPSAILMSSEGGITINSKVFSDFAKMNALYSNDVITVDRMNGNSYELLALLTVFVMVQPGIHQKMMAQKGDEARASGFFGRAMVFEGPSVQGDRFVNGTTVPTEHTTIFNDRIRVMLDEMLQGFNSPDFEPLIIGFTPEASERLIELKNLFQAQVNPGGMYQEASDHVSKLHENFGRVAVLLHHFEGLPGEISRETLDAAARICIYSSMSFLKLFTAPPQAEADAAILADWIRKQYNGGYRYISDTRLYRFGPNSMRKKSRMDSALDVLHQQQLINLVPVGYGNKVLVDIYPTHYPIPPNTPGVTIW